MRWVVIFLWTIRGLLMASALTASAVSLWLDKPWYVTAVLFVMGILVSPSPQETTKAESHD